MVCSAMDNAMADGNDLQIAVAGLKGGPKAMKGRLRVTWALASWPVLDLIGKMGCAEPHMGTGVEPLYEHLPKAAMGRCRFEQGHLERCRAAIEREDGLQGLRPLETAGLQPERPNP